MANPVHFDEAGNNKYVGPGDIKDLPIATRPIIMNNDQVACHWSCWELSDDELAEVLQTKRLWLGCVNMQPPVMIVGTKPEELS